VDVGKQIRRLGGRAPWTAPLGEALDRLEHELKRRGLYLEPSRLLPLRVNRDPSTGGTASGATLSARGIHRTRDPGRATA
jgi:hypothetical protein